MRTIPLVALALLLLSGAALAAEESYRYAAGTGVAPLKTFPFCGAGFASPETSVGVPSATVTVNGQSVTVGGQNVTVPAMGADSIGGGCTIPAPTNTTIATRVVDDGTGEVPFQVFFGREAVAGRFTPGDCAPAVRGPGGWLTVKIPYPCASVHVVPDAGSVAGTIYVSR